MNIVKEVASKVFNCSEDDITVLNRLMGGQSNRTFLFEYKGVKYTFRIPGKKAEKYVDRYIEEKNLAIAFKLGLNNGYVYLNKEEGYMICEYVEGLDLVNTTCELTEVVELMKKYHNSGEVAENDYDPIGRLALYESYLDEYSHSHPARYFELKEEFFSNLEFLNNTNKVFCHNDSQRANFVKADNRLYLLDWEYAGNNDRVYDIACFGNKNFQDAIDLLNVYFDNPTNELYRRLYLWRAFQCLQWHNVAMYKEYIGLSQELSIDFNKVANFYLDLCKTMLDNANNYR